MNSLTVNNKFLPKDYSSKKGSTAEYAKYDEILTKFLSRQARYPMVALSVDAAHCYDRVNHVIMALVWYALIGKLGPITVLLTYLQTIRLFQRTGFGDSAIFLNEGHFSKYLMGLKQVSRGVPPFWVQFS